MLDPLVVHEHRGHVPQQAVGLALDLGLAPGEEDLVFDHDLAPGDDHLFGRLWRAAAEIEATPAIGALVLVVGDAVFVGVGAAAGLRRASHVGADVGAVGHGVVVAVGAASGDSGAGSLGAAVVQIDQAVAVAVGAALEGTRPLLGGAAVLRVDEPVLVAVGAAAGAQRARHLRAAVLRVDHAVAVAVGAAAQLGEAGRLEAAIGLVGHAVPVAVGAAERGLGARQARAGVVRIGQPVPIGVGGRHAGVPAELRCGLPSRRAGQGAESQAAQPAEHEASQVGPQAGQGDGARLVDRTKGVLHVGLGVGGHQTVEQALYQGHAPSQPEVQLVSDLGVEAAGVLTRQVAEVGGQGPGLGAHVGDEEGLGGHGGLPSVVVAASGGEGQVFGQPQTKAAVGLSEQPHLARQAQVAKGRAVGRGHVGRQRAGVITAGDQKDWRPQPHAGAPQERDRQVEIADELVAHQAQLVAVGAVELQCVLAVGQPEPGDRHQVLARRRSEHVDQVAGVHRRYEVVDVDLRVLSGGARGHTEQQGGGQQAHSLRSHTTLLQVPWRAAPLASTEDANADVCLTAMARWPPRWVPSREQRAVASPE